MEIHLIEPIGFCFGVTRALKLLSSVKKDGKVNLLGMIVHNEEVLSSLKKENINIIDERKVDLKEALTSLNDDETVVFSAHGHPSEFEYIARSKNLTQIDATCPLVALNLTLGQKYALEGLIYIGDKSHLEAASFLSNCPASFFFDITSFSFIKTPTIPIRHVICQTTLSTLEVKEAFEYIKKTYPEARLEKSVCNATKSRQEAILKLEDGYDAIIIIGSSYSSNSRKLYSLAKKKCQNSFLVLNKDELSKIPSLNEYKKIALGSGTSTSLRTIDECLDYLSSL